MTAIFGVVGYWLVKHDFEPAPMILGFVLGPLMEENLRRAMLIARGDATVFFTRPISAGLLAISFADAGPGDPADDPRQARRGVHRVIGPPLRLKTNPRVELLLAPGVFLFVLIRKYQ